MRTLNALNLTQATSEVPWPIDFVKITLSDREILRLCNAHHDIDRGVNEFDVTISTAGFDSADSLTITLDGTAFTESESTLSATISSLSTAIDGNDNYSTSISGSTITITGAQAKDLTTLDFTHNATATPDRYSAVFEEKSDLGRYYATGSFLGFGNISDELEIKNNSLDISLSGVQSEFTATFVQSNVEGSLVEVSRGYYIESDYAPVDAAECTAAGGTFTTVCSVSISGGNVITAPEPRWAGRVNSASITDDYNFTDDDKVVVSVSCKSLFESLFKRQSGRFTSLQGFQKFDSADRSMEFMASIALFTPSFGKEN